MTSPYINTKLYTNVYLKPSQLNNKIYLNLKHNLKKNVEGYCNKYGYVSKVYELEEYNNGIIHPENPLAEPQFNVTYSCRLCIPIEGMQIICQIDKISKRLISVKNGPILMIITLDRISDKFFLDQNENLRYRIDSNQSQIVETKQFVKASVIKVTFGTTNMLLLGRLDDMGTEKDKKQFFEDEYKTTDKFIDYDQWINSMNNDTETDK